MCAWRDLRGDLGQVKVHRLGVATRHDERGAFAFLRTDRAENVGRGGPLVARGAWARAALGPTARDLVLLPDPRPRRRTRVLSRWDRRPSSRPISSRRVGRLFKILDSTGGPGMMAGAGRELAITHLAQRAAESLLGDGDTKFLENPLAEINNPPAHHPMDNAPRGARTTRTRAGFPQFQPFTSSVGRKHAPHRDHLRMKHAGRPRERDAVASPRVGRAHPYRPLGATG